MLKCDDVKPGDYVKVRYEGYNCLTLYKVAYNKKSSIVVYIEPYNLLDDQVMKGWKLRDRSRSEAYLRDILPLDKKYWYVYEWEKVNNNVLINE